MSMEEITVDTGYAANLSRDDGDNYLTVSGVAIGEDEVTSHTQGDKFWPAEQLMAATQSLVGVQLTKNHNHNKVEGVIGEVIDARYKEGVGILFEARVYDEEVANKIEEGLLEVSVHAVHSSGGFREEDGAMIVENIEFRDLSVVPRGAAESNQIQVGTMEPATLSAESIEEIVGDEFDTELQEDELDEVWEEFNDTVNMTAAQLRSWSENPCSREASHDPVAVIERNLRLLSRSKDEWTENDVIDAKRTISFVARMSEQQPDAPMDGEGGCPSKWAISLLNWAYNPFESLPSIPEEMEPVEEITLEDDMEEELASVHEVEYDGVEEDSWSAPNLEDFPEEYFDADGNAKFELVDNHFLYSETQFPPENYTELKFPVVSPAGMLNLAALRAAKSRAPQADIPAEDIEQIQDMADTLANREFDKNWGEESAESDDVQNDVESGSEGASAEAPSSSVENDNESQESETMTEEDTEEVDVEALQERVSTLEEQKEALESEVQSVRMEYAEALAGEGSFSAEELADKFTVEELSEKYEDSEAEIAEASEPEPQTGSVEEEEVEASEEEDEEVALLEAQIEKYDEMGWTGAKAEAESKLSTLRDEDAE